MKRVLALVTLVAIVTAAQQAPRKAGAVILGTVTDTNLRPIAGADVNFAGSRVHATSDSLGRFRIVSVPAGRFVMIARTIGFRPATELVDVAADDTLRLAFMLATAVQELKTVLVTERTLSPKLQEFEARRKAGFGEFLTQHDIEARHPTDVVDVLRGRKGVRIVPSGSGVNATAAREVGDSCYMQIYLDGIPLSSASADPSRKPFDLTYLPPPEQIAGIEIYAGASTIPLWLPQGPSSAKKGCGAILLWTRDGS